MIIHPIPPVYNSESKILILGSFPSVKSREVGFFYGHKQNRFWKVMAEIFSDSIPETIDEKKTFLLENNIALWDVIASCDIEGSSDSSIKNVQVNDLNIILNNSKVCKIFTNGKKAYDLYEKYLHSKTKIKAVSLPSTSPANAAWSFEKLVAEWRKNIAEN